MKLSENTKHEIIFLNVLFGWRIALETVVIFLTGYEQQNFKRDHHFIYSTLRYPRLYYHMVLVHYANLTFDANPLCFEMS